MNGRVVRAAALSIALIGWSFTAGLDRPWRRHPLTQAAAGTALALAARAPLGLHPAGLRSGVRLGAAAAAAVTVAVAASTALPQVRAAMAARSMPDHPGRWLGIEIPLGTVWSEETAFRGALAKVAARAFGVNGGRALQALTFGVTHIPDARSTGEPLVGTVAVTAAAGWAFAVLAERSGSLLAPMLAHLAVNEAGAVAALAVQRFAPGGQPRSEPPRSEP